MNLCFLVIGISAACGRIGNKEAEEDNCSCPAACTQGLCFLWSGWQGNRHHLLEIDTLNCSKVSTFLYPGASGLHGHTSFVWTAKTHSLALPGRLLLEDLLWEVRTRVCCYLTDFLMALTG